MNPEQNILTDDILSVAALWAQRCAHGLSANERAQFERWMKSDPRHRQAFAKANTKGGDCDWAWTADAADEILLGLNTRARRRNRRRVVTSTVAVVALCCLGVHWWSVPTVQPDATIASQIPPSLNIVRLKTLNLPDGSVIELRDGTKVTSDFSGPTRSVALLEGTAHFKVAKDPTRPFVVQVGGLDVQAVGTAFTVALETREMTILVTEGRVRVDSTKAAATPYTDVPPDPLVSIDARNSAILPLATTIAKPPVVRPLDAAELHEAEGWRIPRLEFTRTPLREVIAQVNQHNARALVLADESIGDLRVSGILRADKSDILAEMLESDFGLRVDRMDNAIVLSRTKYSSAPPHGVR